MTGVRSQLGDGPKAERADSVFRQPEIQMPHSLGFSIFVILYESLYENIP